MIISHSKKFIFLHTPKTAGSSLTEFLQSLLGPEDFTLTNANGIQFGSNDGRPPKGTRTAIKPSAAAKLIMGDLARDKQSFSLNKSMGRARSLDLASKMSFELTHPSASDVRENFQDIWDDYFKFCFVRNPYALAVSFWKWRTRKLKKSMSFADFLRVLSGELPNDADNMGRRTPWGPTGWKIYTIDDQIVVNYAARMENLNDELDAIFSKLNIPFDSTAFPHRLGITNANATYREFYSDEERALVEKIYANELAAFGYQF